MKFCPKCNKKWETGKFCEDCGGLLQDLELQCSKCGTKLNADAKFCPECGAKVGGSADIDYSKLKVYDLDFLLSVENKTHDSRLQCEIADRYFLEYHDYEKAFEFSQKAANQGDAIGLNNLGTLYELGLGCNQDYEKAFFLYKQAVEKEKSSDTLSDLAECYLYGKGTEVDEIKAFELLEQAYSIDNTANVVQKLLGDCYRNGWGTKQNIYEAIKYYKQAADNNNSVAQLSLGVIYFNGENGIIKNKQTAFQLFKRSAENGNAYAMYNTGLCFENGFGCEQNPEKAFEWYKKSADAGNADGRFECGLCFLNGYGCNKDENYGFQLIKDAAENGSEEAQKFLENQNSNITRTNSYSCSSSSEISQTNLFQKLRTLIAEKLEIDANIIHPDSSFREDLGADSLNTYELVYAIEEEIGVCIPDEIANEFETVRDAYNFILSAKG